ncbi:MAG: ubiquinone biosynthesis protein UbiE [Oscillospiraceae bacterium]|nr:ubiquinone biosynthesis protein UbiE [Oscillospiraceae bacterium]
MEREEFVSGYCRQLDASRMVEVILDDGKLDEVDCCYGDCIYQPNCQIAMRIEELTGQEG